MKRGLAMSVASTLGVALVDMARAAVPQPLAKAAGLAAVHAPPTVSALVQAAP